jgi:hypothetical protein
MPAAARMGPGSQSDGQSFREFCRESGRSRSTAYYRRRRGLGRIAEALNRQNRPPDSGHAVEIGA